MPARIHEPRWLERPDILSYIIDSYAGTDSYTDACHRQRRRRVFIWQEDDEIKMGNTEAFVLHLGHKFDVFTRSDSASAIHKLMRELGESVQVHKPHSPRRRVGTYRQPEPDSWTVRMVEDDTLDMLSREVDDIDNLNRSTSDDEEFDTRE